MDKQFPQRKSPRLKGYDYSQSGAYFVTICTYERYMFFGDTLDGDMKLDPEGEITHQHMLSIPSYWQNVDIDYCVVMPNHVHMIIIISDFQTPDTQKRVPTPDGDDVETAFLPSGANDNTGANQKKPPTLGQIVGNYKSGVTREIRKLQSSQIRLWQSRYHDRIIRTEKALNFLRQYILSNPAKWEEDQHYKETSG